MPEIIDNEIQAIGTVLKALEPLEPKARLSVLDYVIRRLDIQVFTQSVARVTEPSTEIPPGEFPSLTEQPTQKVHIKDLVQEKQPRSSIEMATLVAYYLSHGVPTGERKQTISTKDLETYFKIAGFKLPTKPQFTLPNTKAAGYLDAVGNGEYKLNPVGYNLVVHSMPKSKKATASKGHQRTKSVKKNVSKGGK